MQNYLAMVSDHKGNMMPISSIYGVYKSVHKPFGLMWTMS